MLKIFIKSIAKPQVKKLADKSSFCRIKSETLLHLFYECIIICVIWNDVIDWKSSKLRIPLSFRSSEILFRVEGENRQAKLINYKFRISENLLTTNEAILYIRTVCLFEKNRRKKNKKSEIT